jgi:uncharacterized metal-binding protein YceD (DUF177 family)
LLVLPFGEFELDIAQYIYEMIALSVPLRRVHPGVQDGSLKQKLLSVKKLMEEHKRRIDEDKTQDKENIDPRWDKLKQLLTDK